MYIKYRIKKYVLKIIGNYIYIYKFNTKLKLYDFRFIYIKKLINLLFIIIY